MSVDRKASDRAQRVGMRACRAPPEAFPNLLGLFVLLPKVRAAYESHWARYSSGEMRREVDAARRAPAEAA